MASAIYAIINLIDDKHYIGSSYDTQMRWSKHTSELINNRHHSRYLQFAWNKYGSVNFIFVILEKVSKDLLIQREQWWIDTLNVVAPHGYNIAPLAQSILGIKRSAETKAKISIVHKGKVITQNHKDRLASIKTGVPLSDTVKLNMARAQKGRKHSEETKLKMSIAAKGKSKSEEHKKKNGLAKRNFNKWPHEKGNRCKCDECRARMNAYTRARYHEQVS